MKLNPVFVNAFTTPGLRNQRAISASHLGAGSSSGRITVLGPVQAGGNAPAQDTMNKGAAACDGMKMEGLKSQARGQRAARFPGPLPGTAQQPFNFWRT
jgi:hypothetical protein